MTHLQARSSGNWVHWRGLSADILGSFMWILYLMCSKQTLGVEVQLLLPHQRWNDDSELSERASEIFSHYLYHMCRRG